MATLHTTAAGVSFASPLVLASGIWGVTGRNLAKAVRQGAGGATTKSLWVSGHRGHPNPVIIADEWSMVNAVGLPDGGIEKAKEEVADYRAEAGSAPLIANVVAGGIDDFAEVAEKAAALEPEMIEVNISCPNVASEFGDFFDAGPKSAEVITAAVRPRVGKIPLFIKLSPNVPDIAAVARAAAEAGADGLTVCNTFGPGLRIDPAMRTPVLANKVGGVSGPGVFPLALAKVAAVHAALPNLPIIGTGGVTTPRHALEMLLAGATLVGVGSAVHFGGMEVFEGLNAGIQDFLEQENIASPQEMVGRAMAG